jgi:membrane protease YdiL (CAAX protease family)
MTEQTVANINYVVLGGGVLAWMVALGRGRARAWFEDSGRLDRWPIRNSDFALFALLFFTLFQAGPLVCAYAFDVDFQNLDGRGQLILAFASQMSGLGAWLLFRIHPAGRPPAERGPLLPGLAQAPLALLLVLPFMDLLTRGSRLLLEWLGIDAPLQDIVQIVQQIESPRQVALWVVLVVWLAPVMEELVFRAALFRFLGARMPVLPAALLSGAVFALVHANLASFLGLTVFGAALALIYQHSGRILPAMLLHAIFNAYSLLAIFLTANA